MNRLEQDVTALYRCRLCSKVSGRIIRSDTVNSDLDDSSIIQMSAHELKHPLSNQYCEQCGFATVHDIVSWRTAWEK